MRRGITTPRKGAPVTEHCIWCDRLPREGEKYGTEPKDWDFTNICPECWDKAFKEEE